MMTDIHSCKTATYTCSVCGVSMQMEQPEQDVPVGWLESPDGAFRANPLYKIKFPSKLLSWQVPLYMALPQPEQEPVAWTLLLTGEHAGMVGKAGEKFVGAPDYYQRVNVYTAPPQRKPLTDEQIAEALGFGEHTTATTRAILTHAARAIEAKLKEKST